MATISATSDRSMEVPNVSQEVPTVDIGESVKEFAGQNSNYYTREFVKIQSSQKFTWSFNWAAAAFGPVWTTARGLWGLFWVFAVLELLALVQLGQGLWGDLGADKLARAERLQGNLERMLQRVQNALNEGDTEGAASLQRNADNLQAAADKAMSQYQEIAAGGHGFMGVPPLDALVAFALPD